MAPDGGDNGVGWSFRLAIAMVVGGSKSTVGVDSREGECLQHGGEVLPIVIALAVDVRANVWRGMCNVVVAINAHDEISA